jgi:beta-lactamase superfamily II metal-dependent hydrolase
VFEEISKFIGEGNNEIALLINSHSDSDHLAATDEILNNFKVNRALRTGLENGATTWIVHDDAIDKAEGMGVIHDIELSEVTLPHGTQYKFGEAVVTYLSGFHKPPSAWGLHGGEFRNGNSIIVRVEYKGNSILFTGDAVGRKELNGSSSPPDTPAIATERYLIDNSAARPIASDVLIAPHHGSDGASSQDFIRAVAPRWVIFSAGRGYGHPKQLTANRYTTLGYSNECLLRTDIGDDESGEGEWFFGRIDNHKDKAGDDPIEITLPDDGDPIVGYVGSSPVDCPKVITASDVPEFENIVKKSGSGICHTPESAWYERTKNFTPYKSLAECFDSGGRNPK